MAEHLSETEQVEESIRLEELQRLGEDRDLSPMPTSDIPPEVLFYSQSVDLNEYPIQLLKMRKCRSFRADLRHKLQIIIRAYGGYGHRGIWQAAKALRVHRQTIWCWMRHKQAPKSLEVWCRIDELYNHALEKLVAEKTKKKR